MVNQKCVPIKQTSHYKSLLTVENVIHFAHAKSIVGNHIIDCSPIHAINVCQIHYPQTKVPRHKRTKPPHRIQKLLCGIIDLHV